MGVDNTAPSMIDECLIVTARRVMSNDHAECDILAMYTRYIEAIMKSVTCTELRPRQFEK